MVHSTGWPALTQRIRGSGVEEPAVPDGAQHDRVVDFDRVDGVEHETLGDVEPPDLGASVTGDDAEPGLVPLISVVREAAADGGGEAEPDR